jgi:hypothetical protein
MTAESASCVVSYVFPPAGLAVELLHNIRERYVHMTRHLVPAILVGVLAVPVVARAQHSRGADTPSTGTAVSSAPAPAPAPSSGGSTSSSGGGSTSGQFASAPTSPSGRRRGDIPANGTAVPRGSTPGSGGTIVIGQGSGFYPWGYAYGGALAYGGYYDGYYGAYDPWYGWFPTYAPAGYGSNGSDTTGALRLKVKPSDAGVYVDGFYVGIVDDFDGVFQRLRLDRGPHRVEIRAPQHAPLAVDVMIQEDFTITYRGELAQQ